MKLKRILISQPKPETEKSPWFDLPSKHKVVLDFKPFIHVEGLPAAEFRKQKLDIAHYSCVILNSRNAVDNYFRMANELRYPVPEKTKYFCLTEAIALYLQKYIQYRKRKIFFAQQSIDELAEPIRKNKDEKFLFVSSDKATDKTTTYLENNKINYAQAVFYRTVSSDMKSVDVPGYDMICFFSPNGIQSLFENYPDFKQGEIRIGVFGTTTLAAAQAKGLRVDLAAPLPNAPSMTMALDLYIKEHNAKNGDIKPMVPQQAQVAAPVAAEKTPAIQTKPAPAPAKKAAPVKPAAKPAAAKKPVAKKVAAPAKKTVKAPAKTAVKKAAPASKTKAKPVAKTKTKTKAKPAPAKPVKKKAAVKTTVAKKKVAPAKAKAPAKKVAPKKKK